MRWEVVQMSCVQTSAAGPAFYPWRVNLAFTWDPVLVPCDRTKCRCQVQHRVPQQLLFCNNNHSSYLKSHKAVKGNWVFSLDLLSPPPNQEPKRQGKVKLPFLPRPNGKGWEVGWRENPVQASLVPHAGPELRSHPSPRLTRQLRSNRRHRTRSPRTATAPTPRPPPPTPSCLPPWVPGQQEESLPLGHRCLLRAGD